MKGSCVVPVKTWLGLTCIWRLLRQTVKEVGGGGAGKMTQGMSQLAAVVDLTYLGTFAGDLPLSDWTVGTSMGHFLEGQLL